MFCVWLGLVGVSACGDDTTATPLPSGPGGATLRYTLNNAKCVDTHNAFVVVAMELCENQAQQVPTRPGGYNVVNGKCYNSRTNTPHPMGFCDADVDVTMTSQNCDGWKADQWGNEILCSHGRCQGMQVYDPRSGQAIQCLGTPNPWFLW